MILDVFLQLIVMFLILSSITLPLPLSHSHSQPRHVSQLLDYFVIVIPTQLSLFLLLLQCKSLSSILMYYILILVLVASFMIL